MGEVKSSVHEVGGGGPRWEPLSGQLPKIDMAALTKFDTCRVPLCMNSPVNVPVMAALFIAIGSVLSLVAVVSMYREGRILKRLRARPLKPVTIRSVHWALRCSTR